RGVHIFWRNLVKSRTLLASTLLLALSAACAGSGTPAPADTSADIAAIGKLRADFAAAWNAADLAKLGDLYTADAVSMQENQPPAVGRDAIIAMSKGMLSQMTMSLTLTGEETKVNGTWAYDRGSF